VAVRVEHDKDDVVLDQAVERGDPAPPHRSDLTDRLTQTTSPGKNVRRGRRDRLGRLPASAVEPMWTNSAEAVFKISFARRNSAAVSAGSIFGPPRNFSEISHPDLVQERA
jgi:hypothetical protein